jgi:hypothetical protein
MLKSPASRCWWSLLLLAALAAQAQDEDAQARDAETAQATEFLDFLEYLGSWDGEEQDWVQFMDAEEKAPQRDAAGTEESEHEDVDDVMS